MKEILNKLNSALEKISHPILNKFDDSEDNNEIIRRINSVKLSINDDLVDLYLWRGGINGASVYDGSFVELFSFGSYIDLSSAISLLLLDRKSLKIYNSKLPFIQSTTGDTVSIDLSEKSPTKGMLLLLSPSITLSSDFVTLYDSVEKWIETIIECYNQKAYTLNSDNFLEINFELENEISKKINVNSDFWKG